MGAGVGAALPVAAAGGVPNAYRRRPPLRVPARGQVVRGTAASDGRPHDPGRRGVERLLAVLLQLLGTKAQLALDLGMGLCRDLDRAILHLPSLELVVGDAGGRRARGLRSTATIPAASDCYSPLGRVRPLVG